MKWKLQGLDWPDINGNAFDCRPHERTKNLLREILTKACLFSRKQSLKISTAVQPLPELSSECRTFWSRSSGGLKGNVSHSINIRKFGPQESCKSWILWEAKPFITLGTLWVFKVTFNFYFEFSDSCLVLNIWSLPGYHNCLLWGLFTMLDLITLEL